MSAPVFQFKKILADNKKKTDETIQIIETNMIKFNKKLKEALRVID